MTTRLGVAALAAGILATLLASCGSGVAGRPAHRPISVIFVAGEPTGPWATRTEGLADGVKLAIAERDGLIGDRAVSTVVAPIEQRDGAQVSAAIGGGRILRDSRAIAVLGTYSAPQLALALPQFNGGELTLLQYGTGMLGLTAPEALGEPGRYEPAGARYALRAVPSDVAVGQRAAAIAALKGAQVVPIDRAYRSALRLAASGREAVLIAARAAARKAGKTPLPGTSPALTNPSPEVPDAQRLATRLAEAVRGHVVATAAIDPARPVIVVTDPTELDPTASAAAVLRGVRAAALVVDGADRAFGAASLGRASGAVTYEIRRTVADASTPAARAIRARERAAFGRDRGDAVVAGYRAARRILKLAAAQPGKTIDRIVYSKELSGPATTDPDLPATTDGDASLGTVKLLQLRGSRFVPR